MLMLTNKLLSFVVPTYIVLQCQKIMSFIECKENYL